MGVFLALGGTVTNEASGTIDGNWGFGAVGAAATLINYGTIISHATLGASAAFLDFGGSLTNAAGGVIRNAAGVGVYATGASAAVFNAGTIVGGSNGIELREGGYVSNAAAGTVSSGLNAAVYVGGGAGTVANAGLITSSVRSGVYVHQGGMVVNQAGATISGARGIYIEGGSGTVVNQGLTLGGTLAPDVELLSGGYINNGLSGTIATVQQTDIFVAGQPGVLVNSGLISGGVALAVQLADGGFVTNQSTGTIVSDLGGVWSANAPVTVANAGTIIGFNSGIKLAAGGFVTNQAGGTIAGGFLYGGILIAGGAGTVVNAGSIAGTGSNIDAVTLAAGYSNLVVIDPGAAFTGIVNGGNTIGASAASTLELASGASAGTLTGLGSKYIEFAQTTIDSDANWTLTGSTYLAAGATLTNLGTLTLSGASLGGAATVIDDGPSCSIHRRSTRRA